MIKYKNPVILSTKSDLILRDFDLLDELSRLAFVNVASTVTTMDEDIRRKLEPGAASSARRMEMLGAFRKTKVHTSVHMMPVIPFLTDGEENIEAVFAAAKSAGGMGADCPAESARTDAGGLSGFYGTGISGKIQKTAAALSAGRAERLPRACLGNNCAGAAKIRAVFQLPACHRQGSGCKARAGTGAAFAV